MSPCPIRRLACLILPSALALFVAGTAASATWAPVSRSALQAGSASIYDPVRDRIVEFGGYAEVMLDGSRALSLAAPAAWTYLVPAGPLPPGRKTHVAIYDPVRDRMVIFGGFGGVPPSLADTWALSFSPSPAWTQLPSGPSIGGLDAAGAVYDAPRDRMLLFGGIDHVGPFTNGLWSYDFAAGTGWVALSPTGTAPSIRAGFAMVVDTFRDRVLVLGGTGPGIPATVDVHALSLSGTPSWSAVTASGTPPSNRVGVRAVYDPANDRVLLFGGYDNAGPGYLNEVWSLSLAGTPAWTKLTPAGPLPEPRFYHHTLWDAARSRMLVVSGTRSHDAGVWALSTGGSPAWSVVQPETTSSYAETMSSLSIDAANSRAILYTRASVYALPLDGTPDLVDLHPTTHPPLPLDFTYGNLAETVMLDPSRQRLDLVAADAGGVTRTLSLAATGQSWGSAGSGWVNSSYGSAIYDAAADRFVLFGDNSALQTAPAGTLVWSGLPAAGTAPMPRTSASVTFDPATRRMWVVGGYVSCLCDNGSRLYALDLSGAPTWISKPVASGPRPGLRAFPGLAWDTNAKRMFMYGGSGFGDLWQLWTLGDSLVWQQIATDGGQPPGLGYATLAYDAASDRLFLHGADMTRIYALSSLPQGVGVPSTPAPPTLLLALGPNPVRHGSLTLQLSLPEAAEVRVEVLDVSGRSVHAQTEHRPAGVQSITIATRGRMAPGVYLVRARAAGREAVRRVVVLE